MFEIGVVEPKIELKGRLKAEVLGKEVLGLSKGTSPLVAGVEVSEVFLLGKVKDPLGWNC